MDTIQGFLLDFAQHYTDNIPEIPKLDHVPSPNEFLTDYRFQNKPFIISCPENHLPAIETWQKIFYLEKTLYKAKLTVWVTPFHKTNPIVDDFDFGLVYVEPEKRVMPGYCLLYAMKNKPLFEEFFFVKQQNNLHEFAAIADDIMTEVPFATEALQSKPIAANLSIYNRNHSTLMHKDEYDNFFYVLRGSRQFKLYPPIAHLCMPSEKYNKYQWVKDKKTNTWEKMDLNEEITIIPRTIIPENLGNLEKIEFFRNIKSYEVTLYPGDALYIPSLWFHEYNQSDNCFTLNYQYDRKWDLRFPCMRFLSKLFKFKKPSLYKDASVDIQTELEEQYFKDLWEETLLKRMTI